MSIGYKNFVKGIALVPNTTTQNTTKGDLETLTTDDKLHFHNGTINDPLVGEATSATLTNKVLSGNTATTLISGSGTLTLNTTGTITVPNATDTLVGKATTDTLTNKSISGATNTLTNIGDGSLSANVLLANGIQIVTGAKTFGSAGDVGKLVIAGTTSGTTILDASAVASGTLTLPAATDTLVGKATTDVLTNKTLSGNTAATLISGAGTLTLNTTGTITIPNATDTLMGRTTTDTITGVKTFGAVGDVGKLVIAGTTSGTTVLNASATASGTLTLPAATDTLIGKATTDTLTNKTMGDALTFTQIATPSTPSSGFDKIYSKSDGKFYTLNSTGVETQIGSGSGLQNYITNSDFESNTTGWAAYADAAGTSPVNGTGGSPTVTVTRSTSSPLHGVASGVLTKDAANRQGEGISYDFTIDSADQAKVLQISFDYIVGSGTFVAGSSSTDSDVTLWIYDVTNSVLIQPSTFRLYSNSSTVASSVVSNFQTASNSTSYRLILHCGSTSASAYTIKVDKVSVAATSYVYGTPITDWKSYTLTITGAVSDPTLGTIATNQAYYRRVGDSIEIKYTLVQTAAGTAGSGAYLFSLPPGMSIDTDKVTTSTTAIRGVVGFGQAYNSTVPAIGTGNVKAYNSTKLAMYIINQGVTDGGNNVGSAYFALNNATMTYSFNASVPILGLSSTVQMSDSADTRVVAATYYHSTGTLAPSGGVYFLNTKLFDTHGAYNTSNGVYTIPVSGIYRISGDNWLNNAAANTTFSVYVNGVAVAGAGGNLIYQPTNVPSAGTMTISVDAGDLVTIRGSATIESTTYKATISIERLSGPSSIAATETIAAIITGDPASASSGNPIIVPTVSYDSHGAYNASTGRYTCPASGLYKMYGALQSASAATTLTIYKNAISTSLAGNLDSNGEATYISMVNCLAGDIIDIRPGGTVDATSMTLNIERLK